MSTQRISPGPVLIPPSAADTGSDLRILPAKKSRLSAADIRPAKKTKSRIKKSPVQARELTAAKSKAKKTYSAKKMGVRKVSEKPRILLAPDIESQPLFVLEPEAALPENSPALPPQSLECEAPAFVVPAEPAVIEPAIPVVEPMLDCESPVQVHSTSPEVNPAETTGADAAAEAEMIEPPPDTPGGWTAILRVLTQAWSWLQDRFKTRQGKKRLRVCETVSLGEKRFVAVIQVDGEQFLVGGAANSVSTLARLGGSPEFVDILKSRCEQDLSQA